MIYTELNENINPEELAQRIESIEVVSEVDYGISRYGMIYS